MGQTPLYMGILPPAIITIQTAPGLLRKGGDIVRATSSKKCNPNPESHVSRKVSGRASTKLDFQRAIATQPAPIQHYFSVLGNFKQYKFKRENTYT
jgi:hypothetical protein